MMPDESSQNQRNSRHFSPGSLLALILLIVSALLVYKIQSIESEPSQPNSLAQQTNLGNSPSSSTSKEEKTHQGEAGSSESNSSPKLKPDVADSNLVLTQTAKRSPLLPDLKTVKEGELNSTSWQNPFYSLFWKNQGWQFTDSGMVSTSDQISAATFVRPYKKISVSFRIESLKDPNQKMPSLELQLLTRDPAKPDQVLIASTIVFQNDQVSVSASKQGVRKELKHAKLVLNDSRPGPVSIRLVGTGNRFVISVGGRRVLTCTQPAQQSGRECFLSLLTTEDQVQITALRIEGE